MATMQEAPELGIPEVKPAIESIRGRWEQKMNPQRRHALLQWRIAAQLDAAFGEQGEVGSEWRFYLLPPGEKASSLVPDVAYVSYARMPEAYGELREKPTIAPDIAVEILSPGDRLKTLTTKIRLYLDNGARLIIVVDPMAQSVTFHEAAGTRTISHVQGIAVPDAFPELRIDLTKLFAKI
ncbi:MAG TPA: Uma2 family endonuclease [Candidatus Baltobacteraceae bacterium]|nr:Uma2 family endonuclease [Candidatus Baltobacteraceae bacterium]